MSVRAESFTTDFPFQRWILVAEVDLTLRFGVAVTSTPPV